MELKIQDKDIERYFDKFKINSPFIRKTYAFIETLSNRMSKHNLFLVSAGIAFNLIIYIIPLLLVIIFAISAFFDVNQIIKFLSQILRDIMPPTGQSIQLIDSIIAEITGIFQKGATAGIIGIVVLLWLSSVLLGAIRSGLNEIFRLSYSKTYIVYKLKDIALTLMILLLVLTMIYILPFSNFMLNALMEFIPDIIGPYVSWLLMLGVSLGVSFLNFYLLFHFVPNRKVKRNIRLMSTAFSVIFIEISRHVFAWYISQSTSYSKFYGTFAILVSMSVWVYYLTTILLISAELAQLIDDIRHNDDESIIIRKS